MSNVKLGKVSVGQMARNAMQENTAYAHGAHMSALGKEAKTLDPESRRYHFLVGQTSAHKAEADSLITESMRPMRAQHTGTFSVERHGALDKASSPRNSRWN